MTAFSMPAWSHRPWAKVLLWILGIALLLVLVVAFFPWDTLRGPINRYVTEKTGRKFEITRHLDVKVGRTTRVFLDGIEFANPDWAQDRYLVRAKAAEVHVKLLPLLLRREFELPLVKLTEPELGLQTEPDGRRTWALGSDTKEERNVPTIGAFVVDRGTVHYVASADGADVRARLAMDNTQRPQGNEAAMPLRFEAEGKWKGQAFTAQGRTGDVLYLSAPLQNPFPAEVNVKAGTTVLQARGSVASLATLDGANADVRLQGENLAQLYKLLGVALPDTKPYSVAGQLAKSGETWSVKNMQGRLGRSDIGGDLAYREADRKPFLTGNLRSRMLDFEDLAPVIGLDKPDPRRVARPQPERPQIAAAEPQNSAPARKGKAPKDPNRKVLPNAPLDVSKLNSMNADVRIDAAKVVNAKGLPLNSMKSHVVLRNGQLVLDPLDMGVASGRLAGSLRIDANVKPAMAQARLDGTGLELSQLVPAKSMRNAIGKIQAQVDLTARGGSVAQLLASANGNVAVLMGKGEMSNLALEIAGLDGGEIIKFFTEGDRRVNVRCGVAAFDVSNGLMTSRAVVFDTNDTIFFGRAKVNFANEAMDIYIKPQPKDRSILSLRSPLQVGGTFGAPDVGLDKGALAGRAAAAVALGAINPLLALAATVETGPGRDIDCKGVLDKSAAPRAEARVDKTAAPPSGPQGKPQADPARAMGAGPAPKAPQDTGRPGS
jgi:uncharacterized protein involved in outer membrane biogenesis